MSTKKGKEALQREIAKAEVIAGLQHALDSRYLRFVQAARADWERLIGSDPSDACVTVRVSAGEQAAIRGSGFLKSRRSVSKSTSKSSLPRFAH
jgi:hypothetical protein